MFVFKCFFLKMNKIIINKKPEKIIKNIPTNQTKNPTHWFLNVLQSVFWKKKKNIWPWKRVTELSRSIYAQDRGAVGPLKVEILKESWLLNPVVLKKEKETITISNYFSFSWETKEMACLQHMLNNHKSKNVKKTRKEERRKRRKKEKKEARKEGRREGGKRERVEEKEGKAGKEGKEYEKRRKRKRRKKEGKKEGTGVRDILNNK